MAREGDAQRLRELIQNENFLLQYDEKWIAFLDSEVRLQSPELLTLLNEFPPGLPSKEMPIITFILTGTLQ